MSENTPLPVFTVAGLEEVPSLDVPAFGKAEAYELGTIAVGIIQERALDLAVDVVLDGDLVFRAKVGPGTGPGNDPWLAGKAAAARYFGVPSLLVRLRHEAAGTRFDEIVDPNIDHATMKAHGGSVPIFADGVLVGTITTSGEADVVDHEVAADAVAAFVGRRAV